MSLLIESLYFFLPALIANLFPVLVRRVNFLKYPLDFGLYFRGERILGENKTIRGFLFGCLAGTLVYYAQVYLYEATLMFMNLSIFDYSVMHCSFGFWLSFGALFGDSFKSFFKRQIGIKAGATWPIIDQIDFVLGAFLFSFYLFVPSWKVILTLLLFSPILSFLTHRLGYYLKLIDTKQ